MVKQKDADKQLTVIQEIMRHEKWEDLFNYLDIKPFRDPIYTDYLQGIALKRLGKNAEALPYAGRAAHACIELFKRKGIAYPDMSLILGAMGELCNVLQEFPQSKYYLQSALQFSHPEELTSGILARLGWTLANLNQWDLALEAFDTGLLVAKDREAKDKLKRSKAVSMMIYGRFVEALPILESVTPDDTALNDLASCYGSLGLFTEARDTMSKMSVKALNKLKLPTSMASFDNLPDKFLIPSDQGFGDNLCLLPYLLEKTKTQFSMLGEKELVWGCPHAQIELLKPLVPSNVSFVTEPPLDLPWVPTGLLFLKLGGNNYEPKAPLVQADYDKNGPVGIVTEGSKFFPGDLRRCLNADEEKELLAKFPGHKLLNHSVIKTSTWVDTLNELKKCSRLISIDTGIQHLAGSHGIPCTTLVRAGYDWRFAGERPYWQVQDIIVQKTYGTWKSELEKIC
jgi:tetratricopeptide (TPR) repeat protein